MEYIHITEFIKPWDLCVLFDRNYYIVEYMWFSIRIQLDHYIVEYMSFFYSYSVEILYNVVYSVNITCLQYALV